MKPKLLLATFLFAALAPLAQTPEPPFIIVRLQRMSSAPLDGGMRNDCVVIRGDGVFHREHEVLEATGGKNTDVYEGTLTPADLSALAAVIDAADFKSMEAPPAAGGLHQMNGDVVHISVTRGRESQNLEFPDDAARKKYDKTLKPLFTWWKALEKQKLQRNKAAQPTNCRADMEYIKQEMMKAMRRQVEVDQ